MPSVIDPGTGGQVEITDPIVALAVQLLTTVVLDPGVPVEPAIGITRSALLHQEGEVIVLEGDQNTVSSNGGLIMIPEALAQGTKVTIENVKTQKTVEATVVRPPQFGPDGPMIPVEFGAVSPNFWNIFFPPVLN